MLEIKRLLEERDPVAIARYMKDNGLTIRDGKIIPDEKHIGWAISQVGFWDQRQQARKILLNSLYGALLNEALRFADERMGQSVTLTGRSIAKHMNSQVNKEITGIYDHVGAAICYADTDSSYFSAAYMLPPETPKEAFIDLYDQVAEATNSTFPAFMNQNFNTSMERGAIIAAGRELVASRMLFIKKKKYGGIIYDLEGTRMDTGDKAGKLKAMGLDLKRADTPKFMQMFLERLLMDVLTGVSEKEIIDQIREFRIAFKDRPSWEKGSPKKVSNLTKYRGMLERADDMSLTDRRRRTDKAKPSIPGHVRASLNWNHLLDIHGDKFSMRITDGTRIIVCKLRPNAMGMDSVAYPVDEPHLPQWYKDLPFDDSAMENVIIDKKVDNLLGVLEWQLSDSVAIVPDEFDELFG